MPPTVESIAVTEVNENAGSITVTEAPGATKGDLLVTFLAVDTGGAADIFPVGFSVDNWEPIGGLNAKTDPAFVDCMVEFRTRGTNPTPNLTWPYANAQQGIAIMYRISGHDANDPIGAKLLASGFNDLPESPEIYTEADDSLVLRLYTADGVGLIAAEDGSYPENHTGRAHRETSGPGGITAGAADESVPVAGFSNVGDWPSLLAETSWHAISLEIKAAPVLTPVTGVGSISLTGPTVAGTGEYETGVSKPAAAGL